MRAVVQRVRRASVAIYRDEQHAQPEASRQIGQGLMVLLGVAAGDGDEDAAWIADKMAGIRLFQDPDGKMNLDIAQAGGQFLVVSQFTLLADTRRGRRPSFINAADPEAGRPLYDLVVALLRQRGFSVETGEFGAHMLVEIANDGPVTILLDSRDR